jgi:putative ABC transport system ATP-binding protein
MSTSVIKAISVSKTVATASSTLSILQDISLQVEQGETIALVGVSGAGKSTLMTLLAGLDVPTEGQIELLGEPISDLDDEQRAKIRSDSIGFVFQSFLLIPSLNAVENVLLPSLIKGDQGDLSRANQLLDLVGLSGRSQHLPTQLSGGEQQRVALARAFMTNPKILFADEPTGNLDQHTAATITDLLFELNKEHGTTLVLVTHDPQLAQRCDKTFRIHGGMLEAS